MKSGSAIRSATVPGRVNLIGEWIDFNGGLVLPMAINRFVTVSVLEQGLAEDTIGSDSFGVEHKAALDAPPAGHWADYVRGALAFARAQGWIEGGQRVQTTSTLPAGAGVSSSAATIVATLKACGAEAAGLTATDVALAARRVENEFIGVPCGIMDQMAVSLCSPGHVLALETSTLSNELVALPADWQFLVINSGYPRSLADGAYKARRDECLAAATSLGINPLCKAQLDDLNALSEIEKRRARHAVTEDARSRQALSALKTKQRNEFGELMIASHASLAADMEVSHPAINAMVSCAVAAGADGARITGAGFGGCFVVLTSQSKSEAVWQVLHSQFPGISRLN